MSAACTTSGPITLVGLAASHCEVLIAWCAQDLRQWVAGISADDPSRWIARVAGQPHEHAWVFMNASGVAVGSGGLSCADRSASIWFWVDRRRRESGIGTAGVAAMIRCGLTTLGLRAIDAQVAAHNVGSRGVLERCGFQHRLTAASGVLHYRLERAR